MVKRPFQWVREAFYGNPGRAVPWLTAMIGVGVGVLTRSPGAALATVVLGGRVWDRFSPCMVIEDPRLGPTVLHCPRRCPQGRKQVWLTFDDGPGPDTPSVLDILDHHGVSATFFFIGKKVADYPDLETLRARLIAGGHRVGNHSWSHPNFMALDSRRSKEEITRAQSCLVEAFPDSVLPIFRPPFGYRTRDLFTHLRAAGLLVVGWSVNSLDFLCGEPASLVDRVERLTEPGSILLFHDGPESRACTVAALPQVISSLRARGYTFGGPEERVI